MLNPEDVVIRRTCSVAPEQYDAFDALGNIIGYLRLRWGHFTVEVPDVGGNLVYEAMCSGKSALLDNERPHFLQKARVAISSYYSQNPSASE